jgi:hypothetical protein
MFVAFIQKYRIITENSGHENIQRLFSEVMSRVLRDNYLMYLVLVTVLLTYFVTTFLNENFVTTTYRYSQQGSIFRSRLQGLPKAI